MPRKPISSLLRIMARLRAPDGCPWDQQQTHRTLRYHAVEETYELLDAIEANDDALMCEELGDLLLQIVFHAQLAAERGVFDFDDVCRILNEKLIRRHPHVFGQATARTASAVWAQWDQIKRQEKAGTQHARISALDGIPRHLPALLQAEKLTKKGRKAGLIPSSAAGSLRRTRLQLGRELFRLAEEAQARGWSAEFLLRQETRRQERALRRAERADTARQRRKAPVADAFAGDKPRTEAKNRRL
jgi:NTP pyrophosphatase (non-canonical NTP hydrolase)